MSRPSSSESRHDAQSPPEDTTVVRGCFRGRISQIGASNEWEDVKRRWAGIGLVRQMLLRTAPGIFFLMSKIWYDLSLPSLTLVSAVLVSEGTTMSHHPSHPRHWAGRLPDDALHSCSADLESCTG